jgi:hypothetical protein
MRSSVLILSSGEETAYKKTAKRVLLDPEVKEPLKRLLIYLLVMKGHKGRLGITGGALYVDFSPAKTICEKKPDGALYFSSYALCVSKIVFYDIEDIDRVATVCDRIYQVLSPIISESDVTNEELAGLILSECGFDRLSRDEEVMSLFEISRYKLGKLKEMLIENGR